MVTSEDSNLTELISTKGSERVILTDEQVEELREQLDRHHQDSDCVRCGGCCSETLIALLEDLLEVV